VQKVRRLRLFRPSMKISTRQGDYSHQQLTRWDRFWLFFQGHEWLRPSAGKPTPIVRTKKWTFYFVRKAVG
jgi:hypothetical protein